MKRSTGGFVVVIGALMVTCGCGENKPVRNDEPPQPEMLDKLESDDPDTFLKGVDEARDKYGKKS
jgi:hypothetical protein